ncbi:Mrp/NBP35 family ATP-binding protein [Nocardioides sp. ChNu-153]|uniref:Mrp/NBP35 family ATP-binding protein n=1 Tax=unclassified Nocardioides TaxID=2615069 RepID=UPI002404F453|nr:MULTISPECIES: Mrp/NBP35 family ATP-binding protein [unclassified Nocardioides]MDF9718078.1 Mrp/NBP35 family ATP-binding protein [Nocardioides sp. ChNu-99]MDN7120847.1 Mrp/NBP35 family ATP-binding protein [Nocardioides sp. ChNu-153]
MSATPPAGTPSVEQVTTALGSVNDPEIKRPITELGMVDDVAVDPDGQVRVKVLLTVAGCPLKDTINRDVTAAVGGLPGVTGVAVELGVMNAEQRSNLQSTLRGGQAQREIPFAQPGSLTRVFAIASGKGGVGKSSVTVNLALAMAQQGLKVGVVDADIYGHSMPAMLGVADARPTQVDDLIMPVPTPSGVSVISIGMLKPRRDQVVAWRGPMLDRALVQMLSDVYWGDLDALLLDLPPGTGDIAISLGQHLPNAEVLVVTTPQEAAAEVAERAGTMASMMHQRVVGVVENMSFFLSPQGEKLDIFGTGGGDRVAATLSERFGYDVRVLGRVPLDPSLREGGDSGKPIVESDPTSPAAQELLEVARSLTGRGRGLAGMQLGLTPTAKF